MDSLRLYLGNSIHASCMHLFIYVSVMRVCTWMHVSERVRACARVNCEARSCALKTVCALQEDINYCT
jgi:hypothetical protein